MERSQLKIRQSHDLGIPLWIATLLLPLPILLGYLLSAKDWHPHIVSAYAEYAAYAIGIIVARAAINHAGRACGWLLRLACIAAVLSLVAIAFSFHGLRTLAGYSFVLSTGAGLGLSQRHEPWYAVIVPLRPNTWTAILWLIGLGAPLGLGVWALSQDALGHDAGLFLAVYLLGFGSFWLVRLHAEFAALGAASFGAMLFLWPGVVFGPLLLAWTGSVGGLLATLPTLWDPLNRV